MKEAEEGEGACVCSGNNRGAESHAGSSMGFCWRQGESKALALSRL